MPDYNATAEYFAERAKKVRQPHKRRLLAAEAEYRKLARTDKISQRQNNIIVAPSKDSAN